MLHNTLHHSCPNPPTSHEDTAEQRSVAVLSLAYRGTSPSQKTQFDQGNHSTESTVDNNETSSRTSDDPEVAVLCDMQQQWEDIFDGISNARSTIEGADRYCRRNSSKTPLGQKFSQTELDYQIKSSKAATITRISLEAEKKTLQPKLEAQRKKLCSIASVSYVKDPPEWRTTPSQLIESIGWKGVLSDSDDDEEEEEEDKDKEEEEESDDHDANMADTIKQIKDATIECLANTFENNNDEQEVNDQLMDEKQNELDALIQSELESVLAEEKDDAHSAIAPQQNPHELPITQTPMLFGNERIDCVTSPVRLFDNNNPPPASVAGACQAMPEADPLPHGKLTQASSTDKRKKPLPPPQNHHEVPTLGMAPPHKHHALPSQDASSKVPPPSNDYEGASASVGNFLPILPVMEANIDAATPVNQDNSEEAAASREAQEETTLPKGAWICCETVQESTRRRCSRCRGWKRGRRSLLKRPKSKKKIISVKWKISFKWSFKRNCFKY